MFGSKNSELTRKYSSSSFEAITFGLSSSERVAYSTKPMATKASASPTSTSRPALSSFGGHSMSRRTANRSANGT